MNAREKLGEFAKIVDKEIEKFLENEYKASSNISPIIAEVIKNMNGVSHGGKRLRAAFTYYSYLMFGGKDLSEITKTTIVPEILHSYLLAHDDFMDNADLRHGEPTLQKIYFDKEKNNPLAVDAKHFGNSMAVNIGDTMCHLALEIMTDSNFNPEFKIKAMKKIHRQFANTGYGQILDCYASLLNDVDEDYVLQVQYFKTGKYTYETPLHIGAILAGANDDDLEVLTKYAVPGGIAFQIQDDILGMFGDEQKLGKPADSDMKEGKKTLLTIKAYEKANDEQKAILNNALGNVDATSEDLEAVRKIIIETGSLDYSKNKALELVAEAKKALEDNDKGNWVSDGRAFLDGVADYMINREI